MGVSTWERQQGEMGTRNLFEMIKNVPKLDMEMLVQLRKFTKTHWIL